MEQSKKEPVRLVLPVNFESKPAQEIPLQAFLFNRKGGLIERKDVVNDQAEFDLNNLGVSDVRVFIAPRGDSRLDAVQSIGGLDRFKPYEPVLEIGPEGTRKILPIPDYLSRFWQLRVCRIRGVVTKNFQMGNIWSERGICHARVHICEVDRIWWWINKIPDDIIRKIPEIVAKPKWPIPIPDPGPLRDSIITNQLDAVALNPQPLPPGPDFGLPQRPTFRAAAPEFDTSLSGGMEVTESAAPTFRRGVAVQGDAIGDTNVSSADISMTPAVKNQFLSDDILVLRKAIVDNFQVLQPIFCKIPWLWPYFYRCDEIALVYTDINGLFDTSWVYWWDGDKPDLYFWVECMINGVWTTVYKPPIPCNTYWDYTCGSQVSIHVTDPRVRWECNNVIEGDIVWVKTIGEGASVVHIPQANLNSIVQGKSFNRIGLSDVAVWANSNAVGDYRRPFGGWLSFKVQFGSGLPSNGMYYYRWSYIKKKNADLSNAPFMLPVSLHQGQALFKSYSYEYYDIFMHKHFGSKSFQLGPYSKSGNDDLYIIPPAFPNSAPVNAVESSPLWNQDTWTVWFDSSKFSDGLYEFYLELFDFAGNKLTAVPSQLFQVPDYNTFAPSVDAPPPYLVPSGSGISRAFKMIARIDNSKSEADILKIKVNGSEVTTDCCGFVAYHANDNIEIAFRAYHPQNFATFSFGVQKGTCYDAGQSALTNAGGMVIGDAGLYARDGASIFRHTFTPAQLLGICSSGGKAAFAEHLYVRALATNGTSQLYLLDAEALAAFALDPV